MRFPEEQSPFAATPEQRREGWLVLGITFAAFAFLFIVGWFMQ